MLRGIRWVVDSALLFFFARGGGGLSRGATSGLFNPFRRGALCALAPLFLFAWVLTAPEMAQSAPAGAGCAGSLPTVTEDVMGRRGGATVDPFVEGILSGGPFTPQTDASDHTGTFEVEADGSWTFTLNNNHRFVQALSSRYPTCRAFVARPANGGAPVTQKIRVMGVDDPPTNLTLTWAGSVTHVSAAEGRIPENTPTAANVKVASLSVDDKDLFQPPTFGVAGADASKFVVVGSSLFLRADTSLNRSPRPYYRFKVIATSGGVSIESSEKTLRVAAAAAVSAGNSCTDSDPAVTEDAMGSRGGATVDPFVEGRLSGGPFTPQPDASDHTGTFEVKADGSWTFTLNNNHRFVQGLSRLYGTCRTFVARPANGGAPVTQNIRVMGVDDPPTNLTLTWAGSVTHVSAAEGRISENTSTTPNVKVASLSAENKDFFEPPTFGVAGADASKFVVVGSSLFLKAGTSLDRGTKSYYNFKVRATSGGSTIESSEKTLRVAAAVVSAGNICTGSDPMVTEDAMGSRGGATVDPFVEGRLSGGPFTPQTDASDFTGTFEVKADGSWTFMLNNNHRFVQGLSRLYGTCRTFVARPANGGAPVIQNIRVMGVDDPPTDLTLTWAGSVTHISAAEGRISENTSTTPNVKVASLSAENKDFFEPPTFGVAGADAGYFVVVGSSLFLKAGTSLDRGAKSYYNFEVEATSGGSTLTSNTKTLTVGAAVVSAPSAPGRPTVNPGNRKLEVSWSAPAANGASITSYNVQYQRSTDVFDHKPSSTSTSATIPGLKNGQAYWVRVQAVNSVGPGSWSPRSVAEPEAQVPDRPAKPTVTPGNRKLEVSWSAPSTNGALITGYNLRYSEGNSDDWDPYDFASTSTTTSIPIPRLTNGQSYDVQVRATSSAGESKWSPTVTGTPGAQSPSAPAKPTVTPGNRKLEVSWSAPAENDAPITDYKVQYRVTTSSTSVEWTDHKPLSTSTSLSTSFSTTIEGLTNGQSYQVQVRATSSVGSSGWSPVATGTPEAPAAQAPDVPAKPTLTLGDGQLGVSWTAPSDNGATITDYNVQYRVTTSSSSDDWTPHKPSTTSTSLSTTITGLNNGHGYAVQVLAHNSVGDSEWSESATGTPEPSIVEPSILEPVVIEWGPLAPGGSISEDTDTSENRVKIADFRAIDPKVGDSPVYTTRRRHDPLRGGRQQSVSEAGCEAGSRDDGDLPFHHNRDRRRRARDQLRTDADCNRRQRVIGGK